jgi:hypothetical protein
VPRTDIARAIAKVLRGQSATFEKGYFGGPKTSDNLPPIEYDISGAILFEHTRRKPRQVLRNRLIDQEGQPFHVLQYAGRGIF